MQYVSPRSHTQFLLVLYFSVFIFIIIMMYTIISNFNCMLYFKTQKFMKINIIACN